MNRYEVTVRQTFVVGAQDEDEARRTAIEDTASWCCNRSSYSSVERVVNLSDPAELLVDMAMRLEEYAFQNLHKVCTFCGAGGVASHFDTCIIERAKFCAKQLKKDK